MINYKEAFKLPFTYWRRFLAVLVLTNVAFALPAYFYIKYLVPYSELIRQFGDGVAFPPVSPVDLLLLIIGIAIAIPLMLLLAGYYFKLISNAAKGRNAMPEFKNVGGMFSMGLKALSAEIIYGVLLIILSFIFVVLFAVNSLALTVIAGLLVAAALLALIAAAGYVLPMLITRFSVENKFSAWFEWKKAIKLAFRMKFFVPWIIAVGYCYAAGIAAQLLSLGVIMKASAGVFVFAEIYLIVYTVAKLTANNIYGQAYYDLTSGKPLPTAAAKTVRARRAKK